MRVILVGYPGSQHIVPASKYLVEKYLPEFEVHWLNWEGDPKKWSHFVASYLEKLDDEKVILGLDDYLVSGFNRDIYEQLLSKVTGPTVCAKLCLNTVLEHEEYPVTAQYVIWNREFLVALLEQTTDPWNFEINGSEIFKKLNVKSYHDPSLTKPAIEYNVFSCLSSRWHGVDWRGVKEEDLTYIKENLV